MSANYNLIDKWTRESVICFRVPPTSILQLLLFYSTSSHSHLIQLRRPNHCIIELTINAISKHLIFLRFGFEFAAVRRLLFRRVTLSSLNRISTILSLETGLWVSPIVNLGLFDNFRLRVFVCQFWASDKVFVINVSYISPPAMMLWLPSFYICPPPS